MCAEKCIGLVIPVVDNAGFMETAPVLIIAPEFMAFRFDMFNVGDGIGAAVADDPTVWSFMLDGENSNCAGAPAVDVSVDVLQLFVTVSFGNSSPATLFVSLCCVALVLSMPALGCKPVGEGGDASASPCNSACCCCC